MNRRQKHARFVIQDKLQKHDIRTHPKLWEKGNHRWRQVAKAETEMLRFIENARNKTLTVEQLINKLNKINETKVFIFTDDGYLTAIDNPTDNNNS